MPQADFKMVAATRDQTLPYWEKMATRVQAQVAKCVRAEQKRQKNTVSAFVQVECQRVIVDAIRDGAPITVVVEMSVGRNGYLKSADGKFTLKMGKAIARSMRFLVKRGIVAKVAVWVQIGPEWAYVTTDDV